MTDLSTMESYRSPATGRVRSLPGESSLFNFTLLGIVLKARGLAKKGKLDDKLISEFSDDVHRVVIRHGGQFQITGLQNIPKGQPLVIVSNHMGFLETQLLPWILGCFTPLSVVMKRSLYKSWIFHPIGVAGKSIALSRTNIREDLDIVMGEGMGCLKEGRSLLLFPEGTRKDYFKRSEFNSLGVKLAARAGVPILPLALKTDFHSPGKIHSYFGTLNLGRPLHFSFGEPLVVSGRGKQEHRRILDFIESHLRNWGIEIRKEE